MLTRPGTVDSYILSAFSNAFRLKLNAKPQRLLAMVSKCLAFLKSEQTADLSIAMLPILRLLLRDSLKLEAEKHSGYMSTVVPGYGLCAFVYFLFSLLCT